jgi:RHS repeat-associated protein
VWDNWQGSLLERKRDKTGLEYKRNRYYDPATGRFTQEDPIGLAGGMNLYGFSAGDPVNFSDPFGLCNPKKDPGCPLIEAVAGRVRGLKHLEPLMSFIASLPLMGSGETVPLALGIGGRAAATAGARNLVLEGAKASESATGGFQLGTTTPNGFARLASEFVGEGASLSRSGRALVSADGSYVARFPAAKTYGGSISRMIGNLEIKNAAGETVINAHVPVLFGPGF